MILPGRQGHAVTVADCMADQKVTGNKNPLNIKGFDGWTGGEGSAKLPSHIVSWNSVSPLSINRLVTSPVSDRIIQLWGWCGAELWAVNCGAGHGTLHH